MKLLAGHLKPDQGEITLFGFNPYNRNQTSDHLCYMQEEHPFSVIWKVKDALRFGDYYNPNFDMNFAKELLTDFNLHENKHVTKFPKGMKSALQFIIQLRKSIKRRYMPKAFQQRCLGFKMFKKSTND
ncbi:hypothetical protein MUB24_20210 [Lederbergia sp. NSJ-179]|uniref:hypothetical protein n=1 Tax=Lederbergia sp. NSJ-179 TaxID=2931402 RepID=UPI001FCFAB6A|nr:hypothetical protein [Lederbergia sp. NSJ-179]MCJ7843157.1 hypothetical protein [Lederbergia sp. NSJ-179]